MKVNAWLREQSMAVQAAIGAVVVGVVSFALNYGQGPIVAVLSALLFAIVVGTAYYLGMRTSQRVASS